MTSHPNHHSRWQSSIAPIRIAFTITLSLFAFPAHAKVVYEDRRVICFDNGHCNTKMTQQEMDAAAKYLSPEEQRDYELFRKSTKDPDLFKKLLTTPPRPQSAAPPVHPSGSFPLSAKDVGATIKELKGVDTQNAYMAGAVTQGDAAEYCTRDPGSMTKENGGKLTREQCISEIVESRKWQVYQIQANCRTGEANTYDGKRYTLLGGAVEDGFWTVKWRNNSGEALDQTTDPAIAILEMQFKLVCPAKWDEQQKPQSAAASATGPRRNFEGVWAQTEAECLDEEGPNTRTIIDLKNKKIGALFESYENVCRIGTIEGQNPVRLLMSCYEFWENLEADEVPRHDTVVIASHGPQSISLNGKPYIRCLR